MMAALGGFGLVAGTNPGRGPRRGVPGGPAAAPAGGAHPPQALQPPASAAVASPLPAAAAPSAGIAGDEATEQTAAEPLLDRPQLSNYAADAHLPTMNDVIMQGRARLPELHLDMHVFVQAPDQR